MAPPRKWDPVTKICEVCGSPFEARTAYQIEKQTSCGHSCSLKRTWATVRKVDPIKKKCRVCDTTFEVDPSRASVRFTCSLVCRGKWQTESGDWSGENASMWNGGTTKWWKQKARERDDFTCQIDGCDVRDEGKRTHAHHKLPKAAGGTDDLDNLITFCDHHHQYMEHQFIMMMVKRAPKIARQVLAELYQ
jgi:hypothetical protein